MKKKSGSHLEKYDICIVGGAGHVGLPLGIVFADHGLRVLVYDINHGVLETVRKGILPFMESGAEPVLKKVLKSGALSLSADPAGIARAATVIITIGTPVDEFMNPDTKVLRHCIDEFIPYLTDQQFIILRSTVYPGSTEWLHNYLKTRGRRCEVAFCPERVVQGHAVEELQRLPQIVSGVGKKAEDMAAKIFGVIAPEVVRLSPTEAEFAKLFNNAYRYIQFAITNQFYMIANSAKVDYGRILRGMKKDYPRAGDIPGPGFAAGPCLFKDTMQLAAFSDNQFSLGHAAMLINEGLVLHLIGQIEKSYDLKNTRVGLLGMAFKANSDDTRSSLSYKLKKVLAFHAKEVLTTDPHVVTDDSLMPVQEVIRKSDLLILCVPHKAYRSLKLEGKKIIDIWGFFDRGVMV